MLCCMGRVGMPPFACICQQILRCQQQLCSKSNANICLAPQDIAAAPASYLPSVSKHCSDTQNMQAPKNIMPCFLSPGRSAVPP